MPYINMIKTDKNSQERISSVFIFDYSHSLGQVCMVSINSFNKLGLRAEDFAAMCAKRYDLGEVFP